MGYLSSPLSLANLSPHRGLVLGSITEAMTDGKTVNGSHRRKDVGPAHHRKVMFLQGYIVAATFVNDCAG